MPCLHSVLPMQVGWYNKNEVRIDFKNISFIHFLFGHPWQPLFGLFSFFSITNTIGITYKIWVWKWTIKVVSVPGIFNSNIWSRWCRLNLTVAKNVLKYWAQRCLNFNLKRQSAGSIPRTDYCFSKYRKLDSGLGREQKAQKRTRWMNAINSERARNQSLQKLKIRLNLCTGNYVPTTTSAWSHNKEHVVSTYLERILIW